MFLVIDNLDSFTFNLVQEFQKLGLEPVVLRNYNENILKFAREKKISKVCISPGPGRPENAGLCLKFLEQLDSKVPVLGVCLGHQILGHFIGANIVIAERIMHGKTSMIEHEGQAIFEKLPNPMKVCRYHSLLVEAHKNLVITAQTTENEIMGLKLKNRPWQGIQFHPESILTPNGSELLTNFVNLS